MIIETLWSDEGYDVLIDLAFLSERGGEYLYAGCTLYTSEMYVMSLDVEGLSVVRKFSLRKAGIQTSFVKYSLGRLWVSGDDGILN